MTMPQPLPGFTGVEHIGLTVPNLDAATAFLAALLGAETLYDVGPFENPDDWMAVHLAFHPRARINKMRVLRCGHGPVLELFEFTATDLSTDMQMHSGHGGSHLAFYVEDMDAALAALKTHDVSIQSGPVEMTEGPSKGLTWLYFKSPWGLQMELVSYPGGLAAYQGLREVWRPRP